MGRKLNFLAFVLFYGFVKIFVWYKYFYEGGNAMKRRLLAFTLAFTMAFSTLVTVNAEDVSNSISDEISESVDDSQNAAEVADDNTADEVSDDSDDSSQDEDSVGGDSEKDENSDSEVGDADSDTNDGSSDSVIDEPADDGNSDSVIDEPKEESSETESSSESETESSTDLIGENAETDINLAAEVTDWIFGKNTNGIEAAGKADHDVKPGDKSVTISVKGANKGKFSDKEDTLTYYAPKGGVDITRDFTFSATMNLDDLNTINGGSNPAQSSAGMIILGTPLKDDKMPPSISLGVVMDASGSYYIASNTRAGIDKNGEYKPEVRPVSNKAGHTFVRLLDKNFPGGKNAGTFDIKVEKVGYTYTVSCGDKSQKYEFAKEHFMGKDGTNTIIYPSLFTARNIGVTFTNIKLDVETRNPVGLEIVNDTTDRTALVGNAPKLPGLKVGIRYDDGSLKEFPEGEGYALEGYDKNAVGKQQAKIVIGELSLDYEIEILKKTTTGINIVSYPVKNSYNEGQLISTDNLVVTADYNDGSTGNVLKREDYEFFVKGRLIGENDYLTADLAGDDIDFVIKRKETEGISAGDASASFKASISSAQLKNIVMTIAPAKRTYYVGESADLRGMVIKGVYKSAETGVEKNLNIPESEYSISFRVRNADGSLGQSFDDIDTSKPGDWTIVVSSNFNPALTATFKVSVYERIFSKAYIASYPRTTYPRVTDVTTYDARKWYDEFNGKPDGTTGTTDDETKQYNRGNLEIKYLYGNGAEEVVEEGKEYQIDLSNFDLTDPNKSPNQIVIKFPEGSLAYGTEDFVIPITVKEDYSKNYWNAIMFGASSKATASREGSDDAMGVVFTDKDGKKFPFDVRDSANKENYNKNINKNIEEAGSSVRIWANNGCGKQADSNDGMAYYYTRLSTKDGFKLSADVSVNSYIQQDDDTKRDGQEGFGIMARDVISLVPKNDADKKAAHFSYKIEDSELDENGEPVPFSTPTYNYANMVLLGGYSGGSWPNDPNANNYLFNSTKNRINLIYRTFVKGDPYNASDEVYRSDVTKILSSEKMPPVDEDGEFIYNEAEGFPGPGKKYHLVLERLNGGYKGTCYDYQSKEFKTSYVYYDKSTQERDLDVLDSDNLYVGFFTSRYADIEVSNVNLIKTDLKTSVSSVLEEVEKLTTPRLYLKSNIYSASQKYNFFISTSNNSGGYVTVLQDNDKVICSDYSIPRDGTTFPVTLNANSKTKFTVKFTPRYISEDSQDYQPLSTYEPMYYTYEISHNGNFDKSKEFIYVSPEKPTGSEEFKEDDPVPLVYGKPDGSGEITDPMTFDVALGLMQVGQKIILLPGVYQRTAITEIQETNGGIPAKLKAIIGYNKYQAEEEGYAVAGVEVPDGPAIFDLNNGNNGFVNHSDYWIFKNFHVRNGGKNAKPFHSGGNGCLIENIKVYDSQDSGICLSRTSSNQVTIKDWPTNNIIKNCEVWNCVDASGNNSDGFAIKLTVGYGNKLIGCVSHHNSDDGWDLFCKQSGGYRAPITLEKCVTYKGGYRLEKDGTDPNFNSERGGRNGFKMGGDNMNVNDVLIDCIAFENGNSGVTSNSNPWMTIDGCVGYKNDGANFSLYSSAMKDSGEVDSEGKPVMVSMCDYKIRGVVSYKPGAADGVQGYNYDKEYNYLQRERGSNKQSVNSAGVPVTDDFFKSLKSPVVKGHIPQDPKTGDFLLNGFLELKDSVKDAIRKSPGYEEDFTTTTTETESTTSASGKVYFSYGGGGSSSKSNSSSSVSSSGSSNSANSNTNTNNTNTNNTNTDNANTSNNESSKIETSKPQINEKTVDVAADNGAKISVPESLKDKVSVSASNSFGGNSVSVEFDSSVPPKAETGWVEIPFNGDTSNPDKIIAVITDKDGNEKVIKAGFYDKETGKVLAPAVGSGVYGAVLSDVSFSDMQDNWAKPYVEALAARGIVNGINDDTFSPNAKIKRGDFVLMLANVIDISSSKDSGFSDVSSSDYYSDAIAAAKENGLVKGISDSEFGAKDNISRQDVMTIIARTLETAGIKLTETDISQFGDSDMISDYAKEAISKLVGEGIIAGNNGAVNPKDYLSRAEASKLLYEVWKRF